MFDRHETDVLVVGAGPVGLFAALSLTARDVGVQIIDEEWRTAGHSYALALHPGSLELLEEAGIATELIERGYRVNSVAFYDGTDLKATTRLADLDAKYPFVLVLPQSALEGLMEQHLNRRGLKVQWNHSASGLESLGGFVIAPVEQLGKVSSGYAAATTDWVVEKTLRTRARYAIGADGHRSMVRRALQIDWQSVGEADMYAVFEFHSDADLGGEVRVVLDDQTTNVLWPLPGGRLRWSFQMTKAQIAGAGRIKSRLAVQIGGRTYPQVSVEDLWALIDERAPWFDGSVDQINWSMAVRFEKRLAASFGRDLFWLAGDAAHLTSPVGAQSMNVGLREANQLSSIISDILRHNGSAEALDAYNRERVAEWRSLMALDGGSAAKPDADRWVRDRAARIIPCLPASGDHLRQLAGQIGIEYTQAAAV